jgi:hypothetical protein
VVAASAVISEADFIHWIDWTHCDHGGNTQGVAVTCTGTITTNSKIISVTYNNPGGFAGFVEGSNPGSTDYFLSRDGSKDPATSPFTSAKVDNIPHGDIIKLRYAGMQSLTFSEPVRDLFFAVVSLNGNGYGFDQDFDILSFGDGSNKLGGYWGTGTMSKTLTGNEYQLIGTGEPHGTIVFRDSFTTLSWRSMSNENWNGFTVGVLNSEEEYQQDQGNARGDPHFKTWSGEKYDFHGVCDLVLLDNAKALEGLGIKVHIRTTRTRMWSFISTSSVQIGDDTLEVMGGKGGSFYWVNKMAGKESITSGETIAKLAGQFPVIFHQINDNSRKFEVKLDNMEKKKIVFKTWNAMVSVSFGGFESEEMESSIGLMGSLGGIKMARDGVTAIDDINEFGQEWQVLATEPKLFHNEEGPQPPSKCEIPTSSSMRRRLGQAGISKDDAETACARVDAADFDLCVFDVMATNDKDAAGAY